METQNYSVLAIMVTDIMTNAILPEYSRQITLGAKKKRKNTYKQNFHGIVPGFSGDSVHVFFSPMMIRNDLPKQHEQNFHTHPVPGQSRRFVYVYSEAWGQPQFQEKRSRSEKAILGALGEFRGILGAALGIHNSILGIRNSILGMASHDLSNTKTTILGVTPGAVPGSGGNTNERFSFAPPFSERFFENWGGPRAQDLCVFFP